MVNCLFCGAQNKVSTSKSRKTCHRGPQAFDVNTRAVLGALHAGVGHTHLSAITSTLNIPSISHVSFKIREREIGKATETVAHRSCAKFSEIEKENALEGNSLPLLFLQKNPSPKRQAIIIILFHVKVRYNFQVCLHLAY